MTAVVQVPRIPGRVAEIVTPPFDALNTRAAALRSQGHPVISLGQAVPGFPPPESALRAAAAALASGDANTYSADAGLIGLREALCEKLRASFGVDAIADEVIVTAGANQAFMLATLTFVGPDDEVLLPAPYFVNHEMAVRAVGATPVEVPLSEARGFSVAWADLEPRVTARTRAVVLCNPSNPTGATIEAAEGRRIVRELAERNILVFSDETYMHFVYPHHQASGRRDGTHWSAASAPGWRRNVVMMGTFSKSFGMTGWRVGYVLADTTVCEQAIKIQDATIICAPVISQLAARAAVRESWDSPRLLHDELIARRQILIEEIERTPRLCWTQTNGGFFAFVRVAGCTDSARLARDILEQAHVVTIPGSTFGCTGEGFLRLSYGAVSRTDLREAMWRVRNVLGTERRPQRVGES